MTRDDLLFIVLIGHGTFDGVDAKFNLVGADLESAQWAELVAGLPGRVVVVNTSSASFPFIERLTGDRRVVITATDSVAQRFDTVFPDYFIKAFRSDAADIDKNDRISIWEAFIAATGDVRRHYQRRGQLATERALLDDNGDGVGRDAGGTGDDGSLASHVYLDEPLPGAQPTDEVLLKLLQKRAALETDLDELKVRRSFLRAARVSVRVRTPDGRARARQQGHPGAGEVVGSGLMRLTGSRQGFSRGSTAWPEPRSP